jgi:hypothetical protein
MGRTDNWGEAPLARAKHLIQFLLSYTNHQRDLLYVEWRKEDSERPELYVRTTLLDLALLLNPNDMKSRHEDRAKKEKSEIQNTIDRLKKLRIVEEDHSKPGEKSKGIRNFTFILWHSSKKQENLTQLQLAWGNRPKEGKPRDGEIGSFPEVLVSESSKIELDSQLKTVLKTYLSKSFNKDIFAELDQAGESETGSDHRTHLKEVFIDLNFQLCDPLNFFNRKQEIDALFSGELLPVEEPSFFEGKPNFSAIKCLLSEELLKIVIIGTPGQGKSTLGQQIAQVYRAKWLGKTYEFTSQVKVKRIPFRVELKSFAQWLANNPKSGNLESFLAENLGMIALRPETVSPQNLQDIFLCHESILILDGLDEVSDSDLQERMLAHIYDFIDWAENLSVNLKVVATSRPNQYKNQFDAKRFVHFELCPLSSTQVKQYARQWLKTRNLGTEEQNRIWLTLEECQKDDGISALLKTPLQVTIILLIIKNGGRPPSEREALFNKYWNTILSREKSKDKDIIKSDDNTLLNLHAYLGYILHCRAANKNVRSLLSEEEFRQFIYEFLRKRDSYSPDKDIRAKVEQFVSDAKDRLVLIVAPQPSLFGFELRLFQEFFAAVYLFKTLKRFEHLKIIACSEHWHYVALFLAGRIVRELGDEADNILRQVCRAIDRPIEERDENHDLRAGAWFALQVAADGALSKDYRDLQYEALEYGLEVLETGLTEEQKRKLNSLIGQLSEKDQRDLLHPVLQSKLRSKNLPETCWEVALNLYGQHFGSNQFFREKIETLLETQDKNLVLPALNLALRYESEPSWMVERLQHHWQYWRKDVPEVLFHSHQYTEKLLSVWSLTENEAMELADAFFDSPWRYSSLDSSKEPLLDIPIPKTFSEQLILLLRFIRLITCARRPGFGNAVEIRWIEKKEKGVLSPMLRTRKRVGDLTLLSFLNNTQTLKTLESLLNKSDFIPQFRLGLWTIFWLINKPNQAYVSIFLETINSIKKSSEILGKLWFYSEFRATCPLLTLAVEKQKIEGQEAVIRLLPFLEGDTQISIANQIVGAIKESFKKSDETQKQRLLTALRAQIGLDELLPQLLPLAESMGITVEELIGAYITMPQSSYSSPDILQPEYAIDQLQRLLMTAEEAIKQGNKPGRSLWPLFEGSWLPDPALMRQARQLLELVLDNYAESSEFPPASLAVTLFLKLLAYDTQIQEIAPRLFATLPPNKILQIKKPWPLRAVFEEFSSSFISVLQSFINHEEVTVRVGGALLLKALIDSIAHYPRARKNEFKELKSILPIDCSLGIVFIDNNDSQYRLIGIALLTLSGYPIEDIKYRNLIWENLKQPKTDEEEKAWKQLLQKISMSEEKYPEWRKFLEGILGKPSFYTSSVLSVAMERYQEITKNVEVIIPVIE